MKRIPHHLWLLAMLAAAAPVAAAHLPVIPPSVTEFQARLALLVNTKWLDPLVEVQGRWEGVDNEFRYRAVTLGTYVRPLDNLKVGLFYRLQAGVRHDDDWVEGDTPGTWLWADTTGRLEHELIADISPRFLLPFLPGKDWVLMLKTRYMLSSYGPLEQTIMLRPTLTWFLMVDREPLISLALAYGLYFRLDTTDLAATVLYQHTPYFELLWHLGPTLKLELTGAYKTVRWSASQELLSSGETIPPDFYPVSYRAIQIGLGVLVSLAP